MKNPRRCPTCGKPLFDCGCLDNGKVIAKLDSKNRMDYIYLDDKDKYENWLKLKCIKCKDIVAFRIR